LAGLNSADVRVELYAEPWTAGAAICQEMRPNGQSPANPAAYVYSARTPATRPAGDFTPRAIACHALAMALEGNKIVWQK
jgi:starch phosphorylase